tara:strand:+ start:862 stop:1482 length:621 start_codon:yes stop_codon:yes gene_type:complete
MSNRIREGQKAVHAVRQKIQNKFFNKSKIQVSMLETDLDKDIKAKETLKAGEEYKDRNGTIWIRNDEGQIEQKNSFLGKFTMPMFCPTKGCGKIMRGKADNKMWTYHGKCMDCVAKEETQMRINGTFNEYQEKKVQANVKAWIADMENLLVEWNKDQAREKMQFIMNSTGEMETWDTKDSENKDKTRLEEVLQEVKTKLEENSDEM